MSKKQTITIPCPEAKQLERILVKYELLKGPYDPKVGGRRSHKNSNAFVFDFKSMEKK